MQPVIDAKPGLGCTYLGQRRARFLVWAPRCERVEVHLVQPEERIEPMRAGPRGYFEAVVADIDPGARYYLRLDGQTDRPDPASRSQPEGVHGPSEVLAALPSLDTEDWRGHALRDYIIYELHVGTFSDEGTFSAAVDHLDELVELGVTAVEVMPIAEFPGRRNWGYDGAYPFAVESSYGGARAFRNFVRACHRRRLAVVLDVVYNHLGPEGNYLHDYAPYFTEKYHTPWGMAVNFDGVGSDEVRRYFLQNAAQWFDEFGVDALRLDAVHAIYDDTPVSFLDELRMVVEERRQTHHRPLYLIAETHANDPRLVRRPEVGGTGMDAHWSDDFHHAAHTLLTGETQDYYCDYGDITHLERCLRDGYAYTGQRSAYRGRRHGDSPNGLPGERFVVCVQNHDQVGNRPLGRRLSELASFEQQKLAAAALLLSPFVPLLFMGEEYAETARFPYFINHGDPDLVEAVRRGRRAEFPSFDGGDAPPDPASQATFDSAKLDRSKRDKPPHAHLWQLYRELIALRRAHPALSHLSRERMQVVRPSGGDVLVIRRWYGARQALILLNFGAQDTTVDITLPRARWHRRLETGAQRWGGPGAALPEAIALDEAGSVGLHLRAHSAAFFDALSVGEV